jgi:hypothetical protein
VGDEPDALESVLNIMHYRNLEKYLSVSNGRLISISVLSDKYDLAATLQMWPRFWCSTFAKVKSESELYAVFLAGHMLRLPDLKTLTLNVAKRLRANFLHKPKNTAEFSDH